MLFTGLLHLGFMPAVLKVCFIEHLGAEWYVYTDTLEKLSAVKTRIQQVLECGPTFTALLTAQHSCCISRAASTALVPYNLLGFHTMSVPEGGFCNEIFPKPDRDEDCTFG